MSRKSNHYVDNEKLYNCFVEWYAERKKAEAEGKPEPQPPRYIQECILAIPRGLASKGNFSGYSFKEEMIGDAIENLVQCYRNFDPENYKNPFAYFTQITYYAFLRRITKEKKQSYIKHKICQESLMSDFVSTQEHDAEDNFTVSMVEILKDNINPDLERLFGKKDRKKKTRKHKGSSLEEFLEGDDEND